MTGCPLTVADAASFLLSAATRLLRVAVSGSRPLPVTAASYLLFAASCLLPVTGSRGRMLQVASSASRLLSAATCLLPVTGSRGRLLLVIIWVLVRGLRVALGVVQGAVQAGEERIGEAARPLPVLVAQVVAERAFGPVFQDDLTGQGSPLGRVPATGQRGSRPAHRITIRPLREPGLRYADMSSENVSLSRPAPSGQAPPRPALSATPRTTLRRHKERGSADRADLHAVLDSGLICHLGVVVDGAPLVLPTAYGRDGDTLYLHGSSANGAFGAAVGREVCVTVTHMDGIVCARSVFSHSVNYRSAVVLGTAALVTDEDERWQALRIITDHLVPGRWAVARQPTRKEMAATAVLSLPLAEASVKIRTGMPKDEPDDLGLDVWAGVLPMAVTWGEPQPDPLLREEIPVPAHIRDFPGR
jgi:nitroimidazol reductase NimA-like FMN-containing flavoprotein (pyridoxamine 5'-phosphate oxidase superfamily)